MYKNGQKVSVICSGILAVCLASQPFVFAASAGDINSDNFINITDIDLFRSFLLGQNKQSEDAVISLADMNTDGETDVLDYILIKNNVIKSAQTEPEQNAVYVHLNGKTISADSQNVELNDSQNVITIKSSGEYYFDGTLDDGQICVDVPDTQADPGTVKLYFNGVNITGLSEAPVYVVNAENTSINLVKDTVNYLNDGPVYTQTEAVVFAKDDITFKGEGTLNIYADAHNAVHCSNDLKINGCKLIIETQTGDALRGKNSVEVKSGEINIDAKSDGIKSTKGEVNIEGGIVSVKSGADAVQAETSLNILGGMVSACGDRGLTGIGSVNITGGTVLATATDNQSGIMGNVTIPSMLLGYAEECPKNNSVVLKNSQGKEVYNQNTLKKFSYVFIASESLKTDEEYQLFTGTSQTVNSDSDIFTAGLPASYNMLTS